MPRIPDSLQGPIRSAVYAIVGALIFFFSGLVGRVEEWVPGTTYDEQAKLVAVAVLGVLTAAVNWLANVVLAKLGKSTPTYTKPNLEA